MQVDFGNDAAPQRSSVRWQKSREGTRNRDTKKGNSV